MDTQGFDITVLGSKGGPLEGSTSSFLIKPASLSYRDIISTQAEDKILAFDAGVGLGRITELLNDEFNGEGGRLTRSLLSYYEDQLDPKRDNGEHVQVSDAFMIKRGQLKGSAIQVAYELLKLVKVFLITHPHLDHVAGLTINSAAFANQAPKTVYGTHTTIKALKDHIFNNLVWPDLTAIQTGRFLILKELDDGSDYFYELNDSFRVKPFKLNHGCIKTHHFHPYFSTAYLIQDKSTQQCILVFGDVESDSTALLAPGYDGHSGHSGHSSRNYKIWTFISDFILEHKLHSMVIECSSPNQPPNTPLYGHLSPNTLFEELKILNTIASEKLRTRGIEDQKPLKDFHCLITHVKDIPFSRTDPKKIVLNELNELERRNQIGIQFTILLAGQTYTVK